MRPRKFKPDKSDNLNGTLFEPPSHWEPPKNYPNLTNEKQLGIDIESKDPKLDTEGPGFIRGDAQVVGVSVSTIDKSWYFPIGHLGGGNMERAGLINFLAPLLKDSNRYIVGSNLQYELEAIEIDLGIQCNCRCLDVQVAEALIDEEQESYSHETLCKKYLGKGKDETLLKDAASAYGVTTKGGLWKLPSKYVGPYAEWDSMSAIQILQKQMVKLKEEDLLPIFEIESKLLPILWKMRKQGVPIDLDAVSKLSEKLMIEETDLRKRLKADIGYDIDVMSGPQIQKLCDARKIHYVKTAKGNASFTADWLESYSDPTIHLIAQVRKISHMRGTYVNDWFSNNIRGRIHPQWKQLASDDGGTRTGRMACANPNAQQIPAGKFRTTGLSNPIGKAIRACFISDTGQWAKFDYSQQEPRILTHFAALCDFTGAKIARMAYQKDRKMDFYQYMVEVAGIDRRPAKDMYLGRCYGMGHNKLAVKLGKSLDECKQILAKFDEMVPFVKEIQESTERSAQQRGYIRTVLGRRRHFNYWEPADAWNRRQNGEDIRPIRLEAARGKWPEIRLVRCDTRKALNSLIQGSAADMTKAAIIKIYEHDGTIPYLQVHDEIDIGTKDEKHVKELHKIIENCVDMTVPIRSDLSLGKHWK